jgi:hypothetical protein
MLARRKQASLRLQAGQGKGDKSAKAFVSITFSRGAFFQQ